LGTVTKSAGEGINVEKGGTMLVRSALREYRTWVVDSRYWSGYVPRDDDIIIATAPKCGTTWMQQIVSSLVFGDANVRPLPMVSPWVEARFRYTAEEMRQALASLQHRRFLKTHLPIDGLPLYDDVKYIHVGRDGRDAALSMHNHSSGFSEAQIALFDAIGRDDPVVGGPYQRPPPDPVQFFRRWVATKVTPGPVNGPPNPFFFDVEVGYWAERKRSNVLLVHYADLSVDLEGEMRRIADFLGISIDEHLWPTLVQAARFEAMRTAGDELMPFTKAMFTDGSRRFFNKGINSRWREVFTEDDLTLYEARVRELLTPGLASWLEGGRRRTGDPRSTPD
jgi:aryl sulfotransferase